MIWALLCTGISLLCFGIYRTYLDLKKEKESLYLKDIREENKNLEKNIRKQYLRLQDINVKLDETIDQLIAKEKSINNKIKRFKDEFNTTLNNNAVNTISRQDQERKVFKDIFNKTMDKESETDIPDKYLKIFNLYKEGLTPDQIAEKMDIGVRETRLVFKLYGNEVDNVSN